MTLTTQIALPNNANDSVIEAFERLQKVIIERDETIALRDKLIAQNIAVIAARDHTINLLTEKMKVLSNLKFGRKSERFDPTQQVLFDEAISMDIGEIEAQIEAALSPQSEASAELPNAKPAAKKPMAKPVRKPLPEHLERVIEHVPAQHCECPQCHGVLHQISEEISEKLAVVPPVYFVRHIIRPVMGCRSCDAAFTTPTQPEIINGGMADLSLLVYVLIQKYLDHIPLYRLSEIAKRSGIYLPVSTLAEWVGKCGFALMPLIEKLRQHLHRCAAIHADETPIQMLNPAPKTGGEPRAQNVQRAYLFAYRSAEIGTEPIVIFDFQTSRAGAHAAQFLTGYTGALVVDDFSGYKALFKDTPMKELACWAHARRKFFELHVANKSALAAEALSRIGTIYDDEREVKDASKEARYQHRQTHTRPKVQSLFEWLKKTRAVTTNNTGTAKAMDYLLRREVSFLRFLENGSYPIDNNPVENAIRPIALGRKNWLFAGSARAGERAAAIMSLLATAKACGLNPHAYLLDILGRLPSTKDKDIESLLPYNWTAGR